MSENQMIGPEPDKGLEPDKGPELSRRTVLRRMGIAGAAVAAGPAILAACGSSKKKSTTNTTASSPATTAAGGGSPTTGSSGGGTSGVGGQLQTILGIDPNGKNGKGMSWTMGSVLALTGNGSFYGKTMSRGINLAVKHIAQAGGPNIKVIYKDHKSGDAQAGVQAITELGTSHVPACEASYGADLGVMLNGIAQYKVFTCDGGGGTGEFAQKKPLFWGTRAITPNDAIPGLLKYVKTKYPSLTTVGLTGWDIGEPGNSITKKVILAQIAQAGYKFNGLYQLFPPNTTEFSAVLGKIQANEPDILLLGMYGQDPGFFMNQEQTVNLKAKMFGFEFTPDGINASKGAYDSVGWTFAYDYFDATGVQNPWGKLFVSEFRAAYGTDPDFYAANFYEDTFGMWDCIRRVLATGGDPNSGTALNASFQSNPSWKTVYGGTPTTVDTFTCDPVTHTVTKRAMGVFHYQNKTVTPLAFFGLNASGFRLA